MPEVAAQTKDIPIEFLQRGAFQTRSDFTKAELLELSESIKRNGLVQPIIVRMIDTDQYEIIAGERRWRAAQLAGLHTITCLLRPYTDEQAAAVTAVENVNRVDLNPIEEALAYQKLTDDFAYSHDEVAAAVGKSRSKISNSLRLLALPSVTQEAIITRDLSEGHAKILAGISFEKAKELTLRCVRENISVRKLENLLKPVDKKHTSNTCDIKKIEQDVSEHLGVPVNIQQSAQSFKLQLECYNLEVLNGVLDKIGFNDGNF